MLAATSACTALLIVAVIIATFLVAAATYELDTAPLQWRWPHNAPAPAVTRALSIHVSDRQDREPSMARTGAALAGAGLPPLEAFPATTDAPATGRLTRGQRGCIASHVRALREVGDVRAPLHHWALIFEDDAVPTVADDVLQARMQEVLLAAPPTSPVAILGTMLEGRKQARVSQHVWVGRPGVTSHAYAVRVAAAPTLADYIQTLDDCAQMDEILRALVPNAAIVYARPDRQLTDEQESTSRGLFQQGQDASGIDNNFVTIRRLLAGLNASKRASWFTDMLFQGRDWSMREKVPH
jgi:hypothetical protein